MTRRLLTLLVGGLNLLGFLPPLFADEASRKPVEVAHTERLALARGGVIHVLYSFGSLTVEGWDRPEVEITVIKSRERYYEPERQDRAANALEHVRVIAERQSDSELTISTILPHHYFPRSLFGERGVIVEYQIHVPLDSKLAIHHGTGRVLVSNVTGDIEATSRGGDILLILLGSSSNSIDAKSKLGTVSSDFAGDSYRRYVVGSGFVRATSPPSRRIYVRTGIGGIAIKADPAEALAPGEARNR